MPIEVTYLIAAVTLFVVALNVWSYRYRRGLTPDERAAEDARDRQDLQSW